jgi:ABC-type dipeptide/oligopeptide/nickel transport system permease subunit
MWKGLTGLSLLIGFVLVGADVVIGTTITLLTLAYIRGRVSAVLESPALA